MVEPIITRTDTEVVITIPNLSENDITFYNPEIFHSLGFNDVSIKLVDSLENMTGGGEESSEKEVSYPYKFFSYMFKQIGSNTANKDSSIDTNNTSKLSTPISPKNNSIFSIFSNTKNDTDNDTPPEPDEPPPEPDEPPPDYDSDTVDQSNSDTKQSSGFFGLFTSNKSTAENKPDSNILPTTVKEEQLGQPKTKESTDSGFFGLFAKNTDNVSTEELQQDDEAMKGNEEEQEEDNEEQQEEEIDEDEEEQEENVEEEEKAEAQEEQEEEKPKSKSDTSENDVKINNKDNKSDISEKKNNDSWFFGLFQSKPKKEITKEEEKEITKEEKKEDNKSIDNSIINTDVSTYDQSNDEDEDMNDDDTSNNYDESGVIDKQPISLENKKWVITIPLHSNREREYNDIVEQDIKEFNDILRFAKMESIAGIYIQGKFYNVCSKIIKLGKIEDIKQHPKLHTIKVFLSNKPLLEGTIMHKYSQLLE